MGRSWARVAAIGEEVRVEGFALAGAVAFAADDPTAVRAAFAALPDDIAIVVLTPAAAAALRGQRPSRPGREPLTVVLPE